MANDEAEDQDVLGEISALPADAGSLSGTIHELVRAPSAGDTWVTEAVADVEAAITRLMDEFLTEPFIHRVEHSLHVRLVQLLSDWEHLRGWYRIGGSGFRTQLIHKEWPETRPRKKPDLSADQRRGSFDLVILAPSQLEQASLEQFANGRIVPPIVIEMGLDYGYEHLKDDDLKLANSEVRHPYLVHLYRRPSGHRALTERIIADIAKRAKIAYAWHDLDSAKVYVKHLDDPEITGMEYPPKRASRPRFQNAGPS